MATSEKINSESDVFSIPLYQCVNSESYCKFRRIAEPLLFSAALQRLRSITFLGILSPRFSSIIDSPFDDLWREHKHVDDGSRYSHSEEVARIAYLIICHLQLSEIVQKYAIAWGLTHDIATWALSHTSEPVFAAATKTTARELRAKIILGDSEIRKELSVRDQLLQMSVDPETLINIFNNKEIESPYELNALRELVHSPISPDTIEGMWRSGQVFGVDMPHPAFFQFNIATHHTLMRDLYVPKDKTEHVFEFWTKKSHIYNNYINRRDIVAWESLWTASLMSLYPSMTVPESLLITEEELLLKIKQNGLLNNGNPQTMRYKDPLKYYLSGSITKASKTDSSLSTLRKYLKKRKAN